MFKLKMETPYGTASVSIPRELSIGEKLQLTQFFHNITSNPRSTSDASSHQPFIGLMQQPHSIGHFTNGQTKLGQYPANKIDMNDYAEPKHGLCIDIVAMPTIHGFAGVIGKLKKVVPISAHGWKDILFGNYTGVKFEANVASKIMAILKENDIYAKTYSAAEKDARGGGVLETN